MRAAVAGRATAARVPKPPPEARVAGLMHRVLCRGREPIGEAPVFDAEMTEAVGRILETLRDVALASYRIGEIDREELDRLALAFGSFSHEPNEFIASAVSAACGISPLKRRRPPVPMVWRFTAVQIFRLLVRLCPGRPNAPSFSTRTSPLLDQALRFVEVVGFVPPGRIRPETLYRWYREEDGIPRRRRGRRRRTHAAG